MSGRGAGRGTGTLLIVVGSLSGLVWGATAAALTADVVPGMLPGGTCLGGLIGWASGRDRALGERRLISLSVGLGVGLHGLALLDFLATGSLRALLAFGAAGVGALSLAGWQRGRWRLRRAVARILEGDVSGGRTELQALATAGRLVSRAVRDQAAYQLGALALGEGDLDRAGQLFARVGEGRVKPYAAVGLALIFALRGDLTHAQTQLTEVHRGRTEPGVRAQADAVRVLMVWRRDGDALARELAARLEEPTSPVLLRGLHQVLRWRVEGLETVTLDDATRAALTARMWHVLVPEIGALLAQLEDAAWEATADR